MPNVHAVLLRMFRASCGNASKSGFACGRQGEANLYSTQHALRYIGAYVLVHETAGTAFQNDMNSARVFCFGSTFGYCLGRLAWNSAMHHVEPDVAESGHTQLTLGSVKDFAPWELGYVGTKKASRTESDRNEPLTSTTPPMPWFFEDPNIPPEVIVASAGPV